MLANLFEFAPPLIIGIIVDFLTGYKTGDTLNPLFIFLIILVFSSGIIAILRLRSKQALGDIGINARYRAKVKGFEKLLNFSLEKLKEDRSTRFGAMYAVQAAQD